MSKQKPKSNMYKLSVKQWNPFVGCEHRCKYCVRSFQMQLKRWAKGNCQKCYDFEPHEHRERLLIPLPKTGYGQFIFACATGDIAFASADYLQVIADRMAELKHQTFLIQSKKPSTFARVSWPANVILGTTIESNWPYSRRISLAPAPVHRMQSLVALKHATKMVTIEPVIDFDLVENKTRCIEEIWSGPAWFTHQCFRKRGYGPNGLYCKQHAKMIDAKE